MEQHKSTIENSIDAIDIELEPQPDATGGMIPILKEWIEVLGDVRSWIGSDSGNVIILGMIYRMGIYERPCPANDPIAEVRSFYEHKLRERQKDLEDLRAGLIGGLKDHGGGTFYQPTTGHSL